MARVHNVATVYLTKLIDGVRVRSREIVQNGEDHRRLSPQYTPYQLKRLASGSCEQIEDVNREPIFLMYSSILLLVPYRFKMYSRSCLSDFLSSLHIEYA